MDHSVLIKQPNQKKKLYVENNEQDEGTIDPSSIPWKVYRDYFSAHLHWFMVFVLIVMIVASHSLFILTDWWLARWYVPYLAVSFYV